MPFTYQYTKSGFNTTIIVFKDTTQIYTQTSATAGKNILLDEAKIALQDNYPGSGNMTEVNTTETPPPKTESSKKQTELSSSTYTYEIFEDTYNRWVNIYKNNELFRDGRSAKELKDSLQGRPVVIVRHTRDLIINFDTNLTDKEKEAISRMTNRKTNQPEFNNKAPIKEPPESKKDTPANDLKPAKEEKKKITSKIEKDKVKTKSDTLKANAQRNIQVIKAPQPPEKKIAIILSSIITAALLKILAEQKSKLQDLVVKTNIIVDGANTKDQVLQAITLKNAALSVISSQENKLQAINKQLEVINTILELLSIIISILTPLIALNPGLKVIIDKIKAIIEAINSMLAILIPIFQQAINDLEDLKTQLRDAVLKIDATAAATIPNINDNIVFGTNFGSYKNFTFALKEEDNPKFNVRGNKRHYAIAINRNGTEIVKSDYSFTQDPNDLIEQLKLVIDQQNLQG